MPFLCFPLPVWLGPLLHNSQVQNRILFNQALLLGQLSPTCSREMQKQLSFKWSNMMTFTSSFYCSGSDFSCPLWLGCCTPTPKSSQKSVWPGEQTIWLCSEPMLFTLAEQDALQAMGSVALVSSAWDWHLGYFSLYLQIWADTRAIFCIMHYRVMELKFCSDPNDTCNQKNI